MTGDDGGRAVPAEATSILPAPAKLTLSLRVTGVREDGMHLLDAEMVSIDLGDSLTIAPGTGITVIDEVVGGYGVGDVPVGDDNLVARALAALGRRAAVTIVKGIPAGAGLGGGSADAGAVLRWAGARDATLAGALGADVPFCVRGGRARVTGIGDIVEPLPFEDRRFVLLVPPVAVDTRAVYGAWDRRRTRQTERGADRGLVGNDLEAAALEVAPALARWRDRLAELTGARPRLAGSGSTWFVEGDGAQLGVADGDVAVMDGARAPLLGVRTVRADAGN